MDTGLLAVAAAGKTVYNTIEQICSREEASIYDGPKYDIIFGPVANDDVYAVFALYSSGVLTKEQTLEALKIRKLYNQLVLASEKAISKLKFVKTLPKETSL